MKKWLPLVIIVLLMIIAYFVGLPKYLTFESIKTHREALLTQIENRPVLMPVLFIVPNLGEKPRACSATLQHV